MAIFGTRTTSATTCRISTTKVAKIKVHVNDVNSDISLVADLEIHKLLSKSTAKSHEFVTLQSVARTNKPSGIFVNGCQFAQIELGDSLMDIRPLNSFCQTLTKTYETYHASSCHTLLLDDSGCVYFSSDPQFERMLFANTPLLRPVDLGTVRVSNIALVGTSRLFMVTTDCRIYNKTIADGDLRKDLEDVTNKLRLYSRHNLNLFGSEHLLFVNNTSSLESPQISVYHVENSAECCKGYPRSSTSGPDNYSCWNYCSFAGTDDIKEIFRLGGTILSSSQTFDHHQILLLAQPLHPVSGQSVLYLVSDSDCLFAFWKLNLPKNYTQLACEQIDMCSIAVFLSRDTLEEFDILLVNDDLEYGPTTQHIDTIKIKAT